MGLLAAKAFRIKDPKTGAITSLRPGDPVPDGAISDVQRWANQGFVIPEEQKDLIQTKRSVRSPMQAVDRFGQPIPEADLPAYKARRDVDKLNRRQLMEKAAQLNVDLTNCGNEADIRQAMVAKLTEFHGVNGPTILGTQPTRRLEVVTEPDAQDTAGDARYEEDELVKLKKDALLKVAEDFGLEPGNANKAELVQMITGAPWTAKALSKLSVSKLVQLATEDFGLAMDETSSPADLVMGIMGAQKSE
jgi:hypothetical protein